MRVGKNAFNSSLRQKLTMDYVGCKEMKVCRFTSHSHLSLFQELFACISTQRKLNPLLVPGLEFLPKNTI